MTIPILHPGDAMPKGIAFCSSVAEGVGHVISGSLECALWRPSNTEDIRKEASLVAIPHIRPQGSKDETGRAVTAIPLRGGDVSSACPLVAGLFDEIAEGLTQYYPNEYFRFSPTFRCYVEGFSDCVHTDMLGVSTSIKGVNNETVRLPGLHVVTTVAGDGGTVGLSGIELKENNLWHMVDMRRPYAEFPPEYVHQVAVGDVAIWRSNHPHAAATMSRPESYRVMGAMSPFLTHAPRG